MAPRRTRYFDIFRALLVVLPCLFFLPELLGYSIFAGWDVTRLNLPLKWYDVQSVRDGVLPLWNNYLYAGMPQLAESESGLFYPGNLLLHLPGDFFYWASITYIVHFVLAGIFMDMWLRGRGISRLVSFFGAILFQTAPFLLFHVTSMALMQSVVWLPLLLWMSDRFSFWTPRQRLFALGLFALLGGILIFIGSAQMAFYQGLLLVAYLAGHWLSTRENRAQRFRSFISIPVALIIGAALVGAVVWIPAWGFTSGTVREFSGKAFYYLGSNWLTPSRLASVFFFPAYSEQTQVVGWASSLIYIGFLPTLFALVRLMGLRINWKKDAPLIVMGSVALFFAFGMNNPINHLLIRIAPFSLFRYQGRIAVGLLIALIALAAHALDGRIRKLHEEVDKDEEFPMWNYLSVVFIAIGIIGFSLLVFRQLATPSSAITTGGIVFSIDAVISFVIIYILRFRKSRAWIPALISIYILCHLVIVYPVGRLPTMYRASFDRAMEFFDVIERDDGVPPRLLVADVGRFADRDLLESNRWTPQTHLPNLCSGNTGVFRHVQVMDPYTPLRPVAWNRIIRDDIERNFRESAGTGILDANTAAQLEFLGIDAVVTSGGVDEIPGYRRAYVNEEPGLSYELMELAFGPEAKLFLAENESPRIWSLMLIESGKYAAGTPVFGFNTVAADVSTPSASIVAEVSWSPDWTVTIDGEQATNASYEDVFCTLTTGTGEHRIEFVYNPPTVIIGSVVTTAGLVIVLAWLIIYFPRKQRASPLP